MAVMKSFDDAYLAGCNHCGDTLDWEWNGEDLHFTVSCSCLREYVLVPMSGDLDEVDAPTSSDDEEYED